MAEMDIRMLQNARFEEAAQVVLEETQCRRSIEADLPLMREIAEYN